MFTYLLQHLERFCHGLAPCANAYRAFGVLRRVFLYQMPMIDCIKRLTPVMPTQQQKPKIKGLPAVLISFTILVFSPMAAIASTIKNLLRV